MADLSVASPAAHRVFQEIVNLLDQLQPSRLAPSEQVVVVDNGETWIKLQHDSEPLLRIEIVLNDGWVHFYGAMGHDEAYSTGDEPADRWESDTIDTLAELLQASYTIDVYERRGKRDSMVVEIGEPYNVSIGDLRSVLAKQLRGTAVETQRASFECHNTRSTKTP